MDHELIKSVITKYFVDLDRSLNIVQQEPPELDADIGYIEYILNERVTSDDDLMPLAKAPAGTTILDCGANYGYSATTLFLFGCESNIISFEVIERYAPFLQAIKDRFPGKYDFRMTALSDRVGELTFAQMVLNGKMLAALTTCDKTPHLPSLIKNCEGNIGSDGLKSFKVYEFKSPMTTLDLVMANSAKDVFGIKIDVEGHESNVVSGASDIIDRCKPMILAESGHRNGPLISDLVAKGYQFARRNSDSLAIIDAPDINGVNGFFIHPSRFPLYRRLGLL